MAWKPRSLTSYSSDELEKVGQHSPAFQRYQQILTKTSKDFSSELRLFRINAWCELVAEIFIHNTASDLICHYWSEIADEIVERAWKENELDNKALACFALGKLGSKELNLSSDIDLVIISQNPCPKEVENNIRIFTKDLTDVTEFGFCFRVDYDLRPGGRFAPLVPSLSRTEDHYWNEGRTWERLALVRSRAVCGNNELIQDIENIFQPFTYRKYINYSLFEDLKGLRSDIFQYRPKTGDDSIHLKLMDGGIRDIELFIHALQVIHGGRVTDVRKTGTPEAIDALIDSQCGDPEDLKYLKELYWQLRDAENRSQAKEDSQTHKMSKADDPNLFDRLNKETDKAADIVSEILGKVQKSSGLPHGEEAQNNWLNELGFEESAIQNQWPDLLNLTAKSTRFTHDEEARQSVLKLFAEKLSKGIDPNLGLHYLCDFFKAVRAKSSFFSLFLHEPKLIDDLAGLFATSPALSQVFVNRPELLDSFVFNLKDSPTEDPQERLEQLFEDKLLADVRYSMEFLRTKKVDSLEASLSELADETFEGLMKLLKEDIPSDVDVLKMGKWAGCELGMKSDLDMVLLTKEQPSDSDYKFARRLISRVTESHRGGHFYQIDFRLRPTGSAGPLIMSESNLLSYLENNAESWERQSYLRSRFRPELISEIRRIIYKRKFSNENLKELKDIREKLYKVHNNKLDLKYQPGGLLDIEFSTQIAAIQNNAEFKTPSTRNMLISMGENDLAQSYVKLRKIEQSLHLLTQRGVSIMESEGNELSRLSKVLETDANELYTQTESLMTENSVKLKNLDPIWSSD